MKIMPWCAILLVAGNAAASGMAQTHDGFFLNMALGTGGGSLVKKEDRVDNSYRGQTTLVNFRIGGCPVPNLALSADFQDFSRRDITMNVEGESVTQENDYEISVMSMAFGVTYYIPDLLFVGSNFSPVGQISLGTPNEKESYNGDMLGYSFRIGREWWVSENWGLGVELNYSYNKLSNIRDFNRESAVWITNTYGILFTATFN